MSDDNDKENRLQAAYIAHSLKDEHMVTYFCYQETIDAVRQRIEDDSTRFGSLMGAQLGDFALLSLLEENSEKGWTIIDTFLVKITTVFGDGTIYLSMVDLEERK